MFDDFDDLMAETEIGDFSAFTLSDEEIEAGKKERKAQIERDVKELKKLMAKADKIKEEGGQVDNNDIRRIKRLSSDKMVMIAAMDDKYTIDELVDIENGDYKEEREEEEEPVDRTKEMINILRTALDSDNPLETLERITSVDEEDEDEDEADKEWNNKMEEATKKILDSGKKEVAYYTWDKYDEDDDTFAHDLSVVSKTFWDREHHLDDSCAEEHERFFWALEKVGCEESCESVYATNLTEKEFRDAMDKLGYKMVKNREFNDFIHGVA